MNIRIAVPEDAPAIAHGEAETAQTPGFLVARPGEIPLGAFQNLVTELRTKGRYLVAEEEGNIIGHAFLDPMRLAANAHVFRLTIVVYSGHRHHGVGRALLESLLEWASNDARVGKVELLVRATNAHAIGLYRSLGFVEEGRLRGRVRLPDGTAVDDLTMAWFPPDATA